MGSLKSASLYTVYRPCKITLWCHAGSTLLRHSMVAMRRVLRHFFDRNILEHTSNWRGVGSVKWWKMNTKLVSIHRVYDSKCIRWGLTQCHHRSEKDWLSLNTRHGYQKKSWPSKELKSMKNWVPTNGDKTTVSSFCDRYIDCYQKRDIKRDNKHAI